MESLHGKPVKASIQQYERLTTLSLEETFALIAAPEKYATINGVTISTSSLRLNTLLLDVQQFLKRGLARSYGGKSATLKDAKGRDHQVTR